MLLFHFRFQDQQGGVCLIQLFQRNTFMGFISGGGCYIRSQSRQVCDLQSVFQNRIVPLQDHLVFFHRPGDPYLFQEQFSFPDDLFNCIIQQLRVLILVHIERKQHQNKNRPVHEISILQAQFLCSQSAGISFLIRAHICIGKIDQVIQGIFLMAFTGISLQVLKQSSGHFFQMHIVNLPISVFRLHRQLFSIPDIGYRTGGYHCCAGHQRIPKKGIQQGSFS